MLTCWRLFESGHFSDVTIKYHNLEIKAHKDVLFAKSAELKKEWLDYNDPKGASVFPFHDEPNIRVGEEQKKLKGLALKAAIQFCYTEKLEDLESDSELATWKEIEVFYVCLLNLADELGHNGLRSEANKRLVLKTSAFLGMQDDIHVIRYLRRYYRQPLLRDFGLTEFKKRLEAFIRDKDYEKYFKYTKEIPAAAVDLFAQTTFDGVLFKPSNGDFLLKSIKCRECTDCGMVVRLFGRPSDCCYKKENDEAIDGEVSCMDEARTGDKRKRTDD